MVERKGTAGGRQGPDADEGGFLGRWSRLKAEAKTAEGTSSGASADLRDEEASSDLAALEAEPATKEDKEPPEFDVASLPDIDSLGPGSDFSMFMQAGVPQELKTKALRKLWRVKPELANLDGLLDYGEDLTGSFKVVDQLKTAYQVGRGFLRDQEDETKTADEKAEDDPEAADGEVLASETQADEGPTARGANEADSPADDDESTGKT